MASETYLDKTTLFSWLIVIQLILRSKEGVFQVFSRYGVVQLLAVREQWCHEPYHYLSYLPLHRILFHKIDNKQTLNLVNNIKTMCRAAGMNLGDVQDLLGHADISTTKKMYTHVEIEPLRKAMDMLVDYMNIDS